MSLIFLVSSVLVVGASQPSPNAELNAAFDALSALDFKRASTLLDAAWRAPGNSREVLLSILENQGIVAGSLGQSERARIFFLQMLSLDSTRSVRGDHPPRVMTPYYEARGRVSESGPMKVGLTTGPLAEGEKRDLSVSVQQDPTELARSARLTWKRTDGSVDSCRVKLEKGSGRCTAKGATSWSAEVLNEFGGVLMADEVTIDPAASSVVAPPPSVENPPATRPLPPLRVGAIVLGAIGALALGGGSALGAMAETERGALSNVAREDGVVVGLSQRAFFSREQTQRLLASTANALFIGGAVSLTVAVVLFLVGAPPPAASRVVSVSSGGLVFSF